MLIPALGHLITADLAIDLGTVNTLVYRRGRGIAVSEPSVVAVDEVENEVVAVGTEALEMKGREVLGVKVIRPVQQGVIADIDLAKTMLQHFIRKARGGRGRLSRRVIIDSRDTDLRPRIVLLGEGKIQKATYLLPVGANISVFDGDEVFPGDAIAKIPRETTKTKDITGGLPRVAELFEARKPKEVAAISEIDGVVSFGKDSKGKRKVVITPEHGEEKEYLILKGKHISVRESDHVRAGEALMDGAANPHDILRILGEKALAKYLVDEVQEVYRLQGVRINDKHIELIVRQMLKRVRIVEPGDTDFLHSEHVEKWRFEEENGRVKKLGKRTAAADPLFRDYRHTRNATGNIQQDRYQRKSGRPAGREIRQREEALQSVAFRFACRCCNRLNRDSAPVQ